jgi:cytochrome c oxidase subunit 2
VRRARIVGLGIAMILATAGCTPQPGTVEGGDISALYTGFLIAAAVVAAVVLVPLTWSIVRHRRGRDPSLPTQHRGNLRLEIAWTIVPALLVAGLFVGTLVVLGRVDRPDAAAPTQIDVTAFRWGWSFRYPATGLVQSGVGDPGPEVVVPIGTPIRLTLASNDVIHSFYVPLFLFKRDLNPGRENVVEFTVDQAGTYRGQCAEYCGFQHYRMPFTVRAVSQTEFASWLASTTAAQAGGATSVR